MDLAVIGITFATIFVMELPDKTFLASLVLSTRYRPIYAWLGIGAAFAVQVLIAVALGGVVSLLPEVWVKGVTGVFFLLGVVLLLREGLSHLRASAAPTGDTSDEETQEEFAAKARAAVGLRQIGVSFLILFVAEWGDLTQIMTATLSAKYDEPISVYVGSLGALLAVSGIAVLVGKVLLRYVKLHWLHFVGAAICAVLLVITLVEMF